MTLITRYERVNVYAYNAAVLWAAYGTALCMTLLSVLSGFRVYIEDKNLSLRDVSAVLTAFMGIGLVGGRESHIVELEPRDQQTLLAAD